LPIATFYNCDRSNHNKYYQDKSVWYHCMSSINTDECKNITFDRKESFRYSIKDEMMKINVLIIDTGNHRES